MTQPHTQPNPNELLSITREELERCCSQMSAAGYKVSANYVEAMVLSRSRPHTPAAPAPEPGLSKLCFGTITLACEECRACNEIETCTQKQKYLDYDKQQARKDEREHVLNEFVGKLIYFFEEEAEGMLRGLPLFSEVDALSPKQVMQWIESLRGGAP